MTNPTKFDYEIQKAYNGIFGKLKIAKLDQKMFMEVRALQIVTLV